MPNRGYQCLLIYQSERNFAVIGRWILQTHVIGASYFRNCTSKFPIMFRPGIFNKKCANYVVVFSDAPSQREIENTNFPKNEW